MKSSVASIFTGIKDVLWFTVKWIIPSILTLAIIAALILHIFFLSFVDKHELGFSYNKVTGEINKLDRTGYFLFPPWFYSVHSIDLRPMQLQITANSFGQTGPSINTVNQRVLNAKLVRFNPEGLDTFIQWHGRNAGDSRNELAEILRCYAFDRAEGADCPFLIIEKQLAPEQTFQKETPTKE